MKKTPFLSYILAALLACSVVPQALASTIRIDYDTEDKELDVDDDVSWDCTWDDDRKMWFSNYQLELYADCSIINGGWSAPIYISDGITLTLAEARDWEELKSGELLYWSNDIDMTDLDDDEILMINMRDGSTLDYRNNDLWLGQMSFAGKSMYGYDPTVNLKCNDLVTVSICNRTRDFSIDAHIHFINASSRLRIEAGTNAVFLNCDQDINLAVDKNDAIYMTDGRFISGYGYRTRLNGATLNLPDNATSKIEGYLCGTSTITLGDGTTVQGRNETSGSYQYFSWLLNDIEVRENCSATMTAGYYGGNITMQKGSSLQFDMLVAPAGVDSEHWNGGVKVDMNGGNTLDLAGKQTTLDLTVTGQENKNTLQNGTFAGTAVITDGSLALPVNMDPNAKVTLQGDATLDLGGQTRTFGLTVAGTGNTLKNGAFIGSLTLAENSYLYSDSAMASWDGPTSITMKNGSRLEMAVGYDEEKMAWRDCWINDISAIKVDGVATIKDAFIRIKPGTEYTLGNGVENLVGEGITSIALDNSIFNLDNKTTNLNIKVWAAFDRYNVIKNGTVNTHVEIDSTGKLALQNVTLGDNASFTMGNNTQLDMGGASIKLSKISLAASATATVDNGMLDLGATSYTQGIADAAAVIHLDQNHALQLGAGAAVGNGRLCLPGSTNDTPIDYTLNLQGGESSSPAGSGVTLNLGESVTFATNHNTRFLLNEECIGNPDCPVNIVVTASGHFILGDSSRDQTVYGDVNLTHTGDGPAATPGAYDVEMNYRLIGNLTAEMKGRSINIGVIGDSQSTEEQNSTASVTGASKIALDAFTGASMKLQACETVVLNGDAKASGALEIGGPVGSDPDIIFQSNLSAGTMALTGRNISGTGAYGDMSTGAAFVEFADSCTINATEAIDIKQGFKGGNLTVTGGGNVMLDLLGISEDALLAKAEIISQNNGISMRSFTGGSLSATAKETVTIGGNVTASTGDIELTGASVSIGGSLAANNASANITSTTGDISIAGTLSAQDTSTLDSAEDITIGGNMTGGALTATAAQSILLKDISIRTNDNDAALTATGGSITAANFDGGSLTAKAAEAVAFSGNVASRNNASLTGASVGVYGSITTLYGRTLIASTGGDIAIGGTLSSGTSSTLDSAGDITLGTLDGDGNIISGGDVSHGALAATAANS
ncbi:MAG: hypothetical protein KBT28_03490, partial [Bacteroidales bacterium]|nr:hypothetical protein [Candidatus Colimorpha merdihippi]